MRIAFQHAVTLTSCALACAACFPSFQTARIDPGFRLSASAVVLGDQPRHDTHQGTDIIGMISPSFAFGRRFEIGVPVGVYAENGLFNSGPLNGDKNAFIIMPYLKLALLESDSPNHLAVIAQSSAVLPANVGIRFGHNLGAWEPHVGLSWIFSGGEPGDDPTITRYQERNQLLLAWSVGATLNRARNTAIEIGVLRNRYDQSVGFNSSGSIYETQVWYDAYVGLRFNLIGGRR